MVHYGGADINKYVIIDSDVDTGLIDKGLKVSQDKSSNNVTTTKLSRSSDLQLWKMIKLSNKPNDINLASIYNNKYLTLMRDPNTGVDTLTLLDKPSQSSIFNYTSAFTGGDLKI